jgi:hypothetical protein
MIAKSILDLLRGRPKTVVELPRNFLRCAFQTTIPGLYRADHDHPFSAASEITRAAISKFSIDGIYASDDVRLFRVNQKGAAAIFTETVSKSGNGRTAIFMLTQAASPSPEPSPHLETTTAVPVFVFSGQYRKDDGVSRFVCSSIHHKTTDIPADVLLSDARKGTVRVGEDWLEVVSGLTFGEQCFQQFLRGERLSPKAAQAAIDQIPVQALNDHYQDIINPNRTEGVLQLAARLPL